MIWMMKSRFSCLFLLRATLTGALMKSLQAARKRINRSIQVEHPFPYLHLPSPSPCPCLWVQLAFLREERSELPRRLGSTATLHRMTGTQLILHFPFSSTLPHPSPFSISPFLSSWYFFLHFLLHRDHKMPILFTLFTLYFVFLERANKKAVIPQVWEITYFDLTILPRRIEISKCFTKIQTKTLTNTKAQIWAQRQVAHTL